MGGVVQVITGIATDVGDAITGGIKDIGNVVQEVGSAVGSAVEHIGNAIKPVVQKVESDPIGTIAQVAAVATGQAWALPLISAADTIAHGGSITQAAEGAAMSYVAGNIASGVSDALLAPAADSTASIATQDASNMVAQGIPPDQIANTLQQSYNLAPDVANSMAQAASAGVAPSVLATAYAGAYGAGLDGVMTSATEKILAGAAGNTVGAAAKSLITTGNIDSSLLTGLATGVGTAVGGGVNLGAQDIGLGSTVSTIAGKIAGATSASAVAGQNIGATFVSSLVNTSLSQIGSSLKNTDLAQGVSQYLSKTGSDIATQVNQTISGINDQQKQQQDYYTNTVTPAYTTAQTSYNNLISANDAYNTAYTSYTNDYNNYTNLVSQYNAAKAANDVTTANSLADQINTLTTTLSNDTNNLTALQTAATNAGNQYNTDYQTYQTATTNYTGQTQAITDANAQLNQTATQAQTQISDYTTQVQNAVQQTSNMTSAAQLGFNKDFATSGDPSASLQIATSVNSMDKPAQDSFTYALDNGINPQDAVTVAPQLANMSATATKAFYNDITTNGMSPAQALQTATQVNSLDPTQQAAYFNAASQGLDHTQALDVANNASMLGSNAQNTYIQSVKAGTNNELAQIVEATQQLVSPGSAVTNVNAPSTLTDPNAVQIYNDAIAKNFTPQEALAMAQGYQASLTPNANTPVAGPGVGLPTTSTQQIAGTTYAYNKNTGQFDIPVADTAGGTAGATSLTPTETTGAGAATGSATDTITQEQIAADKAAGTLPTMQEIETAVLEGRLTQSEANAYTAAINGNVSAIPVTPTLQDFLSNIATSKQPAATSGTTPTTAAVPGGAPSNVTATIPGGAGSNVGTGTSNVAGTGNGAGTVAGTGTGAGGTGIGIGGIGVGTGGSGTLTGTGGLSGLTTGASSSGTNPGLVNLVGGTTGGKEISLVGLPTTQDTINPVASAPAPQSAPQMDPIFSKKGGKVKKKRKK